MEELGSTPQDVLSIPRGWDKPCSFGGNFSKKLLLSHGAPEIAQCELNHRVSVQVGSHRRSWTGPFQTEV